ncbi:MAG TPA: efflux RND transporter periplasmic adaptor subunit [Candidatus Acidoferrales bacterium]|nr:efflux RND transporter periplasmic adaptor subunit [Candidatus Acidoferrales bacterium]
MGSFPRAAGSLLLAALFALVGCAKPAKPVAQTPFVATSIASSGTVNPNEPLPGLIAPYQNVAIQSTLTEPADAVYVNEGDRVRKGEVIAVLDTADLVAQLQSDIATAHADAANTTHTVYQGKLSISQGVDTLNGASAAVQQAEKTLAFDSLTLKRDQQLLASGFIAQQTVDQQETLVHNDQQTLRSAQASQSSAQSNVQANGSSIASPGLQQSAIEQSRAQEAQALANARQVQVSIDKAKIVSPVDGVVVNRNLNPGEYPGTRQIFTLQQVNPLYAVLQASGEQVAQIAMNAHATISVSDLGGRKVSGPVVGILNQIVPGSTNFEVKVQLDNSRGKLRPGMAILGTVDLPPVEGVRVPVTAFTSPNRDRILSVDDQGLVHTVHVVEVADNGQLAVVRGVPAGTRVVTDGQSSVGDGEKVAIK